METNVSRKRGYAITNRAWVQFSTPQEEGFKYIPPDGFLEEYLPEGNNHKKRKFVKKACAGRARWFALYEKHTELIKHVYAANGLAEDDHMIELIEQATRKEFGVTSPETHPLRFWNLD